MKQKILLSFSVLLGLSFGVLPARSTHDTNPQILESIKHYKPSGANSISGNSDHENSPVLKIEDIENRSMYGVIVHNPLLNFEWGIGKFNAKSTGEIELLHPWSENLSIFAGAAAYDEYYAFFYTFDAVIGPKPETLSKVNLRTGEIRRIKDWSNIVFKLQDMTYNYSSNTMWGLGFFMGASYLYRINLDNGDINEEVKLERTLVTLAASYSGNLYGIDTKGNLCQINPVNGMLTIIAETGIQPSLNQSMDFDHTDGSLYWASNNDSGDNHLIKFDIEKKTYKSVGLLGGNGTQVMGLYIPYVTGGFSTPGEATNPEFIPADNGKEEATISWTNPAITHGGDPLTSLSTITIERNGEIITSFGGIYPGEQLVWKDRTVKTGEHIYSILATNEFGDGRPAKIDGYVGKDIPERVKNINIESGENCKSIYINWDKTILGGHNGYFTPEGVNYKITRYPDKVVVADKLTETSFKDESMKRLAQYYYGITASNEIGSGFEGYTTDIIVAGNPVNIPYSCEFMNEFVDKNQWSSIDGNKDGLGWYYNAGYSNMFFGGISYGIEYVQMGGESDLDADEWLISPPTNFEAGKDYCITFESRSIGEDLFNVTIGTSNNIASQIHKIQSNIKITGTTLKQYSVNIPQEMITPGINCFGFNLVTPYGRSPLCQLTNIAIQEVEPTSINNNAETSKVTVFHSSQNLEIRGDFNLAEIYSLSGHKVMQFNSGTKSVNTSGWNKGTYIARIITSGEVLTCKFMIK
ncbi:MAG: choice-of-anchor J domain-containing protein [Bacteroidales bacterium]